MIKNELAKLTRKYHTLQPFKNMEDLSPEKFKQEVYDNLLKYLNYVESIFRQNGNKATEELDNFILKNNTDIKKLENSYSNEKLQEIVTKYYEKERNKILEYKNGYVQNYEPIYLDPEKKGFLNFRTHFFAPSKCIFGGLTDTFDFNITIVLLSTIFLYLFLYYEVLGKVVGFFENLRFRK